MMKTRNNKKISRPPAGAKKRTRMRRYNPTSVLITALVVFVFALILAVNLFRIQVVNHASYRALAANQHYSRQTVYPRRGSIFDSDGTRIAGTKMVYRIGMTPRDARSIRGSVTSDEIAAKLSAGLDLNQAEFRAQMDLVDETYILLAVDVAEDVATELRTWLSEKSVGGFRFDAEPRRVYSNNHLAGQVIGFARFDDQMLSGALGLELQYDALLSGKPGYSFARRDNFLSRGVVPYAATLDLDVEDGADLHLTLDLDVQRVLYETLVETAASVGLSTKVSGIVMDPWTGAILAMEQLPTMRSDSPFAPPDMLTPEAWESMGAARNQFLFSNVWRNQNVSDLYEPGSTMKAVTTAVAFETDQVNENSSFSDDPIEMRGHEIKCFSGVGHGIQTVHDGFVTSCNPVFVQVGQRIGSEVYYDFIRQIGLYERTGIDLPQEARAIIHTSPTDLDFANMTFGESSVMSPLRMLTTYAMFANGGHRVTPHVVSRAEQDGRTVYDAPAELGPKVFSEETTSRIRKLLGATGRSTLYYTHGSEGYRIGGKTSTSTDELDGQLSYSYIAVAPIDAPRVVAMILIQKPSVKVPSSIVAARPTNRLISRVLDILGEKRRFQPADFGRLNRLVPMPNLVGMTYKEAAFKLSESEVWAFPGGEHMRPDDPVMAQMPAAGTPVSIGSRIYLYPAPPLDVEWVTVPDFSGKSFFECQALAADAGVVIRAVGVHGGGAVRQSPAPTHATATNAVDQSGAPLTPTIAQSVPRGSVVTIYFNEESETEQTVPDEAGD